ncbi:GroES-like protein [Hymenopellis radicata]|nr:GroES-like protein [Hymenopellis radicata]
MATQQALFIESKQGPFVLGTREIPTPPKDEVLIKITATGLNPVDWKIQAYGAFVQEYPAIVGSDIAGEIEAVGADVEGWKKGDKVFCQGWFSNPRASFQQYTLMPADLVAPLPTNIDLDQAATICVAFMAACMGLFADAPVGAGLNPTFSWEPKYTGQTAVVIGGSTSVGQYAIQLLKFLGFTNIYAYASAHQRDFLGKLGATGFIDRKETSLASIATTVSAFTTPAPTVVFDTLGFPEAQQAAYDTLADDGGKAITIMTLHDRDIKMPNERKKLVAVLGSVHPPTHREFGSLVMKNLGRMVEEGIIVPNRLEVLPGGLGGIIGGLERLKKNEVSGMKLVAHPQEA